jgi:hypothetical protein
MRVVTPPTAEQQRERRRVRAGQIGEAKHTSAILCTLLAFVA